uniref:Speckle-type protein n=1 Tax=Brachypodium sylvaticum TaxID=29664 RepID=C3TX76_BRASY|nr:speckle-type protein [Brachypodium sylvaticum]
MPIRVQHRSSLSAVYVDNWDRARCCTHAVVTRYDRVILPAWDTTAPSPCTVRSMSPPPTWPGWHLEQPLETEQGCDVTFRSGPRGSPELHEMAAADHSVRIIDGMTAWMLAAACRFRLERMKRLCENLLAEHVSIAIAKDVTAACLSLFLDGRLIHD